MESPLAYHITFGTYGTRLHGDDRGTVDRSMNGFGDPIVGACKDWERMERKRLRFEPRILTREQMIFAESLIPAICVRGGWTYRTCATGPDHVHVLLAGNVEGDAIRKWLKRWLSEGLTQNWALRPTETWWAEAGSVKWVWTEEYLKKAFDYVIGQRATQS